MDIADDLRILGIDPSKPETIGTYVAIDHLVQEWIRYETARGELVFTNIPIDVEAGDAASEMFQEFLFG